MKKWKYCKLVITDRNTCLLMSEDAITRVGPPEELFKHLNALGWLGWELVSVTEVVDQTEYHLKKELGWTDGSNS